MTNPTDPAAFLAASEYIDWRHPAVLAQAAVLAAGADGDEDIAKRCFEFVRDRIQHSWDYRKNPVTCRASEVLSHATGYCYAKSHLLAALLRASRIPAGLCYQRLSLDGDIPPYCLHGLNAVYLTDHGWYRLDARGNKAGVAAEFCPPDERLAFVPRAPGETDIAGIWAEPLPPVIRALTAHADIEQVYRRLPDFEPGDLGPALLPFHDQRNGAHQVP
ncbi:transglutaminase family protein [Methylococcaceae bacterium WWC4]|nr:transglutaminase family protein [Methylococcaceae bacterium WWC4]